MHTKVQVRYSAAATAAINVFARLPRADSCDCRGPIFSWLFISYFISSGRERCDEQSDDELVEQHTHQYWPATVEYSVGIQAVELSDDPQCKLCLYEMRDYNRTCLSASRASQDSECEVTCRRSTHVQGDLRRPWATVDMDMVPQSGELPVSLGRSHPEHHPIYLNNHHG